MNEFNRGVSPGEKRPQEGFHEKKVPVLVFEHLGLPAEHAHGHSDLDVVVPVDAGADRLEDQVGDVRVLGQFEDLPHILVGQFEGPLLH